MFTVMTPIPVLGMELTFQRDMPGFRGARRFVVEPLQEGVAGVFAHLRCTDAVQLIGGETLHNLALLVMSPGYLWREYGIQIDDEMVEALDLRDPEDAALLAIVHPREPLSESTANLYSPIVVNRRTGFADQFVPAASETEIGWSVRTPFPLDRDD